MVNLNGSLNPYTHKYRLSALVYTRTVQIKLLHKMAVMIPRLKKCPKYYTTYRALATRESQLKI
jgi:hypothetical protein